MIKLFANRPYYILVFDNKLLETELSDLQLAGDYMVDSRGKEIETTDKKVFNQLKKIADEIGLSYTPIVETIKS